MISGGAFKTKMSSINEECLFYLEHYDKGFSYPGHNPIRLFMSCLSTEVVPSSGFYDTRWLSACQLP